MISPNSSVVCSRPSVDNVKGGPDRRAQIKQANHSTIPFSSSQSVGSESGVGAR
jgi:hypothetical protein